MQSFCGIQATVWLQDTTCGHKYQVAGAADALHSIRILLNEFVKRFEPLLHGHNSSAKGKLFASCMDPGSLAMT